MEWLNACPILVEIIMVARLMATAAAAIFKIKAEKDRFLSNRNRPATKRDKFNVYNSLLKVSGLYDI